MNTVRLFTSFGFGSLRIITSGNRYYWAWMFLLLACMGLGLSAYVKQLQEGLITTSMRDQVSWGFYIGNFTFLVGVAEAAVTLVIPAYFYNWRPVKEIVAYGILLAVAAIICCTLFVMVDIGRPERFWHLIPGIGGRLNLPSSLLAWDVIALNGYVLLNFGIVTYLLFNMFRRVDHNRKLFMFFVWISIPAAIGIHMVTAFLYSGLVARPYWNTAILAPRFIASAFCAGPAILLVALQLLRKFTAFHIRREAIWKIAELMAYFMGVNLFLLSAEIFQEYYGGKEHVIHLHYMFSGVNGHDAIVPWMWTAVTCSTLAFLMFLRRGIRENPYTLNIGCALIVVGVYLEKSMGMVIPGMTPDPLGEIYEYVPSWNEIFISIGIMAVGALLFTLMVKIANQILHGQFNVDKKPLLSTPLESDS